MLDNFHLTAIVRQPDGYRLVGIPLHQDLQQSLAVIWENQMNAFIADVQNIPFDAGYQPEEHERFVIRPYVAPDWLREDSQTVGGLEPIANNEALFDQIKGIAAFARNERGVEVVLFQNFSRSHVIRPGQFLLLRNDTYESSERPGLTLETRLSAVYLSRDRSLLFHNFRTVNTFLPLTELYEDASEQDIRDVLAHERFAPENVDALAINASQWFRKRFAILRDSGVLDQYSARQIQDRSKGYDLKIRIAKGSIIFPENKLAAKKLLQFLNEELFLGPITETLYETNSKREAD